MRLVTASESQSIDFLSGQWPGLNPETLMENAGSEMARVLIHGRLVKPQQKIAILCGPGNNGGDGFVVARHLLQQNFPNVQVYYFATAPVQAELWHEQFSQLFIQGHEPLKIEKISELDLSQTEVIIDALFGSGLKRKLASPWTEIIEKTNLSSAQKVSLDLPSGLHPDCGVPFPVAVKADFTIVCQLLKPGMLIQEGPNYVGELLTISVGFPDEIIKREAKSVRWLTKSLIAKLFPHRNLQTNKAKQGHLLVIAGSKGMTGALQLCAESASKLGVGYVTICCLAETKDLSHLPADFLTLPLADFFKSDLKKYSAIVVGPGLGRSKSVLKIIEHLLKNPKPTLVDADALTAIAETDISTLPGSWLLTPHAGELSRLLNKPSKELEENRLQAVDLAFKKYRCHILFKGFRTVVFNSQIKYIIGTGNAALAKAGTGDVLAGFIGSLLAQGLKTDEAAAVGALIHGDLADQWVAEGRGDFSLMASDLIRLAQLSRGEV